MRDYHCCATCNHFRAERKNEKMIYFCSRLGYETKTTYKFNCWNPKEKIKNRIEKEGGAYT
jgi:ribosomal protein L37AE/L43A